MKDIWKPKHKVWFKKNDDDELGKGESKEEKESMGDCPGCGMAYSFAFGTQFHKKGCPYNK